MVQAESGHDIRFRRSWFSGEARILAEVSVTLLRGPFIVNVLHLFSLNIITLPRIS
jgi:hypothetical protein